MKSKLVGIKITPQETSSGPKELPAIILDPEIERTITNVHTDRREIVRQFCGLRIAQKLKKTSVLNYCKAVTALETVGKDYHSITKEDMVAWVSIIDKHYTPATAQLYQALVKNFMRWVYYGDSDDAQYPEPVRWIKTKKLKEPYKKPILSKEEIMRLVRATNNQRDRALLFCTYESGCRAGEVLGLKVKDVTITQTGAEIRVDGKTGPREVPLIESVPDIVLWLSMHPHADEPECCMWPTDKNGRKGMAYATLFWMIGHTAMKAGLPKGISPHCLRHASVTHLSSVLNESQLRVYYGWENDSKMPSRYVHPNKVQIKNTLLKSCGMLPDEKKIMLDPTLPKACPRCTHSNSALSRFCMSCGMVLDIKTAVELQERTVNADNFTADILQELMRQMPEMVAKVIAEKGGFDRVKDIVGEDITFGKDQAIKFIL